MQLIDGYCIYKPCRMRIVRLNSTSNVSVNLIGDPVIWGIYDVNGESQVQFSINRSIDDIGLALTGVTLTNQTLAISNMTAGSSIQSFERERGAPILPSYEMSLYVWAQKQQTSVTIEAEFEPPSTVATAMSRDFDEGEGIYFTFNFNNDDNWVRIDVKGGVRIPWS